MAWEPSCRLHLAQYLSPPLPVLKKVKHRLVENMSSGTADALGLSRAILCNGELPPPTQLGPWGAQAQASRGRGIPAVHHADVGPLAWPTLSLWGRSIKAEGGWQMLHRAGSSEVGKVQSFGPDRSILGSASTTLSDTPLT